MHNKVGICAEILPKKHLNAKSSSLTVAKRLLAAILSVEVIIG